MQMRMPFLSGWRAKFFLWAGLVMASLLFVGCSTLSPQVAPPATITYSLDAGAGPDQLWPDDRLREVFARYWSLRFSDQSQEAFKLETPYFQEMVEAARYRIYVKGPARNELINIEVRDLVQITAFCVEITMVARIKIDSKKKKEMILHDRWVNAGEQWYHILRDPIFFKEAY